MLPVSSDTTSSPIFRSLISFCLPDPVVTRVSGPKQPLGSKASKIHLNASSSHQSHALPLRLCRCCCIKVRPKQCRFQTTLGPSLSVHLPVSMFRKGPVLVLCAGLFPPGGNTGTPPTQIWKQIFENGWKVYYQWEKKEKQAIGKLASSWKIILKHCIK